MSAKWCVKGDSRFLGDAIEGDVFQPETDSLQKPIQAAKEVALAHGITPDRCDILQNGSTLVLRLTESLVARVVQDVDGPRQGTAWFARENAVATHLARNGAPVIPLHPELPPGPYEHLGYPINFWKFVTVVDAEPQPAEIGRTLQRCQEVLSGFGGELPELAIVRESVELLGLLKERRLFQEGDLELLRRHLGNSLERLNAAGGLRPLHGDAHTGNLLNTTGGLLWTDWEDTFAGPVEWDLASVLWNARFLEGNQGWVDGVLAGFQAADGEVRPEVLEECYVARAAVMTAWYPVLYPNPDESRRRKLEQRLDWLRRASGFRR